MIQLERFGDDRIKPYVEWSKNKGKLCAYCYEPANTRDHIPSKVFLDDNLPDFNSTIPACEECNKGFSKDEEYVACSIDYLKSCIWSGHVLKDKTIRSFERSILLEKLVKNQFYLNEDGSIITISTEGDERFKKIMIKLAVGHARHDHDYMGPYDGPHDVDYSIFNDESDYNDFDFYQKMDICPEIGSRGYVFAVDIKTGQTYHTWTNVQSGNYTYHIHDEKDKKVVTIIIGKFFLCSVRLIQECGEY